MKKLILLFIISLFLSVGCAPKYKESIEGVWQMVSAKWIDDSGYLTSDTTIYFVLKDIQGGVIKAWFDGYVIVAGTMIRFY